MFCITNPLRKKFLKEMDVSPALCWSTSLWPVIQAGLKLFCGCKKDNLYRFK